MTAPSPRAGRWATRILLGLGALVVGAAAGIWWWAGQEGSLEWVLQRVARGGPLQTEGVRGSIRGGWHVQRITWEGEGLRVVAEDVRLAWQPLAILNRTLQLDEVRIARVHVVDERPDTGPMQEPGHLRLPWRVRIDDAQLARLEMRSRTPFEAAGLSAEYAFDGLRHRVKLRSLQFAGGAYEGEGTLLATSPLTVEAKLSGRFLAPVPGVADSVPLTFELQAQGPARELEAKAQLRVVDATVDASTLPQATATAQIAPFDAMPLPRAAADFRRLDIAMFWPSAPRTLLSGHVDVAPAGEQAWHLQADVRNEEAGAWDAGRLPLRSLRGEGEWRNGTALLRKLHAEAGGGTVEGEGDWRGEGWHFAGRVAGVDPSQLHGSLAPLPLSGPLKLEGAGKAVDFDVALEAGAARRRSARDAANPLELRSANARGRWAGDVLDLRQLRVRTSDATLEGQAALQLAARSGEGRLQLRAPGLQAQVQGSIAERSGRGTANVSAADLAQVQRWVARWPGTRAALEGLALRGEAQAQLAWQGGWRDPTVQGSASARSVAWQPAAARDATTPPPWVVRDASLRVNGRLRDAALEVQGRAEQGQRQVNLATSGRLGATFGGAVTAWRGQFAQLAVQLQDPAITPGPWQLQLRRPVAWKLAGGNFEVEAGEAVLRAPAMRSGTPATDAVLAWTTARRQGQQLTTAGRFSGLPLAWIELLGGQQFAGTALSGDLVFDAEWNAVLGDTLRVDASLVRTRGDVNVLAESADGAAARVTAGVRQARLSLSSQGDQLVASLLWDSERAGRAEGQVRTRLVRSGNGWSWPEDAPLSGRIQAALPRIGVWSLLAPPGWRLRGSLSADIAIGGTRAQPQLNGPLLADDLALRSVVDGIELKDGRLRAQLAGQRLVVGEFLLRGSDEGGTSGGSVVARGEGSWTPAGVVFSANAQLSQLRASLRSDRQLTVSGPLTARMDAGGTAVTGNLVVDRARIQIPDESPPRLGEDVVVRNATGVAETEEERKVRPPAEPGGRALDLRVNIDLGRDFRASGRGLDTRLAGSVQVVGVSLGLPEITGVISTRGGTFEAYGQRMTIERGILRFTGVADNPALDILAVRPNMTQKVGVLVSGRAQAPHIELYSDSGLSDAETLSQVVLGRSSSGGGAETALLQRAASALLAGRGGTGKGLVGRLGLDDLSVSPDSTSGAVVRVGKRFADNFYAAYERSLSGAMGTLFIFYDVSRRVTLRAEAGERTGLDLILTFAFDGAGKR